MKFKNYLFDSFKQPWIYILCSLCWINILIFIGYIKLFDTSTNSDNDTITNFLILNWNLILIMIITVFTIWFGFQITYKLFVSKKYCNYIDTKNKFLTFITLDLIYSFGIFFIVLLFTTISNIYKNMQMYSLYILMMFFGPFFASILFGSIFLLSICIVRKKWITIPIISVLFAFFSLLTLGITQRSFSGPGDSNNLYSITKNDTEYKINYYQTTFNNKEVFIPYYAIETKANDTNTVISKQIVLFNQNTEDTNYIQKGFEYGSEAKANQAAQYLIPTSFLASSLNTKLDYQYIYNNNQLDENNLNSTTLFLSTENMYRTSHYANADNNLQLSTNELIANIKDNSFDSNPNVIYTTDQTVTNYLYISVDSMYVEPYYSFVELVLTTLVFSGISFYLYDKKQRCLNTDKPNIK